MLTNGFGTLKVAVLSSRRAPGLEELLHHPLRDSMYEITCVVTTEEQFADADMVQSAGVPLLVHSLRRFCIDRGRPIRDMNVRREFDAATAEVLRRLGVDTVLLVGYLYVVTDPMLAAYPSRIFNVHDSDLTIRGKDGQRKYTGLHSTRDAIADGRLETRSSVHIVTEEIDAGPLLLLGRPVPVASFIPDAIVASARDVLKAYSFAHREWMMRSQWGELLVRTVEYLAAGVATEESLAV